MALALAGGVVLSGYGGLLVVVGALVLGGIIGPAPPDDTVLRWHVHVWDAWFFVWGLALLVAAVPQRSALRRRNEQAHSA